jgi:hypothetical protein
MHQQGWNRDLLICSSLSIYIKIERGVFFISQISWLYFILLKGVLLYENHFKGWLCKRVSRQDVRI